MKQHKFIFDVDGTLTPSRGRMDKKFAIWFSKFCENEDVYLVTGSDRPKTIEQVGEYIYHKCKRVYQCSGCDVYQGERNIRSTSWKLPDLARQFLLQTLDEEDFDIRTGNHIEERPGMVNYSVVGRNATQQDRKAFVEWESFNGSRRRTADAFNIMFPDLQATVGGETGIDISPRGADKSQILVDFTEDDTMHFFGDAMFEGGNDKLLADALQSYQLGFSHQVRDWEHTWEKLREHTINRS